MRVSSEDAFFGGKMKIKLKTTLSLKLRLLLIAIKKLLPNKLSIELDFKNKEVIIG